MEVDRAARESLPEGVAARAAALTSIVPSPGLASELREEVDADPDAFIANPADWTPIDVGLLLDGEPWGWVPTRHGRSEGSNDSWLVLPLRFFETAERLVSLSAWQRGSMTGFVGGVGALRDGPITLSCSDLDEAGRAVAVDYAAMPIAHVVQSVVSNFLDNVTGDRLCLACEENFGWKVTVEVGPSMDRATTASLLEGILLPCTDHAAGPLARVLVGEDVWEFGDGGWEPERHAA